MDVDGRSRWGGGSGAEDSSSKPEGSSSRAEGSGNQLGRHHSEAKGIGSELKERLNGVQCQEAAVE
jgi:hypothetical protein